MAPGIATLDISAPVMGRVDTVHLALLWDDQDVVLVDTGFPRQLDSLQEEIKRCGVPIERLNRIVLTHQDIDHIGNLPDLLKRISTPIEVLAHPDEKPYIEGERRLIRFTDEAIASIDRMPSQVPESFKQGLKALMLNPPSAPVDRTISGGETLPWCGEIDVIDTPGHTPGHIGLYHKPSRTLIAGDSLTVVDGDLRGPDPVSTLDMPTALASLRRLLELEIDTVVCYHGGVFKGPIHDRLSSIIQA
ncbi:MBL fold metallo-hydrolase [Cohnella endophytica]|uniref:MBL fold metallo-hydrolase n=1 Tax=Cohnella endophytica TaxID=2419778 RepID=A0A494XDX9_9BACL|nr:MBL fold metallo-hydrolase [Cohnella endophytica]